MSLTDRIPAAPDVRLRMGRHRRPLVAAVIAPALSLMLAGCGSSSVTAVVTGQAPYADTVAAKSADISVVETVQSSTISATTNSTGSIAWAAHTGLLHVTSRTGAQSAGTTLILDGPVAYVQIPLQLRSRTGGRQWIKITESTSSANQSSPLGVGNDPAQALEFLRSVSSSVTKVGPENVAGVPTTHYRAVIDPAKAAAGNPGGSPADSALAHGLAQELGGRSIPVDLWIDAQSRLRQLHETFTINSLQVRGTGSTSPATTTQQGSTTISLTLSLSNFGVPVNVTAPPAGEVFTTPGAGDPIPGLAV